VKVQEPVKAGKAQQVFHLGDGKGFEVKVFFDVRVSVFQYPELHG
jgi:hypothetical protein